MIFLDGIPHEPDRLPVTGKIFHLVARAYNISPWFVGLLYRQQMVGRALHHEGNQVHSFESWLSTVIRSLYDNRQYTSVARNDLSRRILDWQRYCVWSLYETASHRHTAMIWRCPTDVKQWFFKRFVGAHGQQLMSHPMLLHAFFCEELVKNAYDFLQNFSDSAVRMGSR